MLLVASTPSGLAPGSSFEVSDAPPQLGCSQSMDTRSADGVALPAACDNPVGSVPSVQLHAGQAQDQSADSPALILNAALQHAVANPPVQQASAQLSQQHTMQLHDEAAHPRFVSTGTKHEAASSPLAPVAHGPGIRLPQLRLDFMPAHPDDGVSSPVGGADFVKVQPDEVDSPTGVAQALVALAKTSHMRHPRTNDISRHQRHHQHAAEDTHMDGAMACMQEVDAVRQDALGHAASSGQSGDECEEDFAEQGQSMEQMLQNERRGKHNGLICAVPTCKKFARLSREGVRKWCIFHMRRQGLLPKMYKPQRPSGRSSLNRTLGLDSDSPLSGRGHRSGAGRPYGGLSDTEDEEALGEAPGYESQMGKRHGQDRAVNAIPYLVRHDSGAEHLQMVARLYGQPTGAVHSVHGMASPRKRAVDAALQSMQGTRMPSGPCTLSGSSGANTDAERQALLAAVGSSSSVQLLSHTLHTGFGHSVLPVALSGPRGDFQHVDPPAKRSRPPPMHGAAEGMPATHRASDAPTAPTSRQLSLMGDAKASMLGAEVMGQAVHELAGAGPGQCAKHCLEQQQPDNGGRQQEQGWLKYVLGLARQQTGQSEAAAGHGGLQAHASITASADEAAAAAAQEQHELAKHTAVRHTETILQQAEPLLADGAAAPADLLQLLQAVAEKLSRQCQRAIILFLPDEDGSTSSSGQHQPGLVVGSKATPVQDAMLCMGMTSAQAAAVEDLPPPPAHDQLRLLLQLPDGHMLPLSAMPWSAALSVVRQAEAAGKATQQDPERSTSAQDRLQAGFMAGKPGTGANAQTARAVAGQQRTVHAVMPQRAEQAPSREGISKPPGMLPPFAARSEPMGYEFKQAGGFVQQQQQQQQQYGIAGVDIGQLLLNRAGEPPSRTAAGQIQGRPGQLPESVYVCAAATDVAGLVPQQQRVFSDLAYAREARTCDSVAAPGGEAQAPSQRMHGISNHASCGDISNAAGPDSNHGAGLAAMLSSSSNGHDGTPQDSLSQGALLQALQALGHGKPSQASINQALASMGSGELPDKAAGNTTSVHGLSNASRAANAAVKAGEAEASTQRTTSNPGSGDTGSRQSKQLQQQQHFVQGPEGVKVQSSGSQDGRQRQQQVQVEGAGATGCSQSRMLQQMLVRSQLEASSGAGMETEGLGSQAVAEARAQVYMDTWAQMQAGAQADATAQASWQGAAAAHSHAQAQSEMHAHAQAHKVQSYARAQAQARAVVEAEMHPYAHVHMQSMSQPPAHQVVMLGNGQQLQLPLLMHSLGQQQQGGGAGPARPASNRMGAAVENLLHMQMPSLAMHAQGGSLARSAHAIGSQLSHGAAAGGGASGGLAAGAAAATGGAAGGGGGGGSNADVSVEGQIMEVCMADGQRVLVRLGHQ